MSGHEGMTLDDCDQAYIVLTERLDGCKGIPGRPGCILSDLADRVGTNKDLCIDYQCPVLMNAVNQLRRQAGLRPAG